MPLSVSISGPAGKPGQVYYALVHNQDVSPPKPQGTELLLHMRAAALNHRDLFIRQHLYPGVTFAPVPLGADGCGVVVSTGPDLSDADKEFWLGKRVVANPGLGWEKDPAGPEDDGPYGGNYLIMGGTKFYPKGTIGEYLVIESSEVELAPEHLSDVEAAALPLTGLTAWRACGPEKLGARNVGEGKDVLVTGIGGGVALMALVILNAKGTRVWVTSSSQEKLEKAKELGAAGGVSYKEEGWEAKLLDLVKGRNGGKKKLLDGIVDGAGGDIGNKAFKLLKSGTALVTYGMTVRPTLPIPMQCVLKNIDIRGSTMGSRQEFRDMIRFFSAASTGGASPSTSKLKPVVSRVVKGIDDLEKLNTLWEDMKQGVQFGKLVVVISEREETIDDGKGSKL